MDTSNLFSCSPGVCFLSYATKNVQSLQPGVLNVYWGGRTGPVQDEMLIIHSSSWMVLVFLPTLSLPSLWLQVYICSLRRKMETVFDGMGVGMGVRNILSVHSGRAGNVNLERLCHHLLSFEAHVYTVPLGRKISFIMKRRGKHLSVANSVSQKSKDKVWSSTEHHPGNAVSGTQMTGLDSFHSNESQWTAFRANFIVEAQVLGTRRNLKVSTLAWMA